MSRNLAIDFGNTAIKIGVFENERLLQDWRIAYDESPDILRIIEDYNVTMSIICSVVDRGSAIKQHLQEHTRCMVLRPETPVPFLNAYLTSASLGMDRLALVAAAFQAYPHNNNLVISVGTAVTYNVLTSNRTFRGGNITPGIGLRLRALNEFTDKLPLVDAPGDTTLLGYDTESSIRSGVINGVAFEIDGFINAYKEQFKDINVFLTGGDASILGRKLKNTTFADANLQLKGLNSILLYNAK